MRDAVAQSRSPGAEGTALLRSNRSADPGAKTEQRAAAQHAAVRPSTLRDWHKSEKPSRHDAATPSTGRPSQLANVNRAKVQFPLNQDSRYRSHQIASM